MECKVTTDDGDGTRSYVGITVCDGPGQHRLILTRPYQDAGQVVEIPTADIEAVEPLDGSSESGSPAARP